MATSQIREYKMSFFGEITRKMISARQSQVDRYVRQSLLALDDKTLKEAGFDRETLKRGARSYYI